MVAENVENRPARYVDAIRENRTVRIGVAENVRLQREVSATFTRAIDTIGRLGFGAKSVVAPLRVTTDDLSKIESDRRDIASKIFEEIDILLLQTTTTTVPTVANSLSNPQALSAGNTIFAKSGVAA